MNKLQIWWNKNILKKDVITGDFTKSRFNSFYKIGPDLSVYHYSLIDNTTAIRDEMELPNSVCKLITNNKVLEAMKNRGFIHINENGIDVGNSVNFHFYYKDNTYVLMYDDNYTLKVYQI